MPRLYISSTRDYFLTDEERFFYLADTCWSAFTNPSYDEWRYYLEYRFMQGFNAIQINILPQWDRSYSENYMDPFQPTPGGGWDFDKRNEAYFDRAEKMIEIAVDMGFIPALVVLWCNYVRGTWGSRIDPSRIIPVEKVEDYVCYIAERFGKYNPIFIVSGDTNFETEESIEYYTRAMDVVKREAPNSLTTMHLSGGLYDIPDRILKSPNYDFYMYQSGHRRDRQHLAYELAQRFYNIPVKKPIVNGEPCYEGIGSIRMYDRYGRFTYIDVRRAIWQSLLSGAKAGIAYGAHGVWLWYKGGVYRYSDVYGQPYHWIVALKFPGAFDAAFARWVFERYDLFDIEPANDRLVNRTDEIRVSIGRGKIVVYTPYNCSVGLRMDGAAYRWEGIELEGRRIFKPRVEVRGDETIIKMADFNSDILVIGYEC
ncbi:MAG: DUF4038 domain-containing protein [Candidatus Bathyarchaeia archaeon]